MNNVERTLSIRYLDVESLRKTFFKDVSISFGKIVLVILIDIFVRKMIRFAKHSKIRTENRLEIQRGLNT